MSRIPQFTVYQKRHGGREWTLCYTYFAVNATLYVFINNLHLFMSISLTLNLPMTTVVAQPFNVIKWQLKFNPVA
jgi:hypothetical protein